MYYHPHLTWSYAVERLTAFFRWISQNRSLCLSWDYLVDDESLDTTEIHDPTNILELASPQQVVVLWWQGWLPNYTQRPISRPLVVMRRIGTEEASHHYPASGTRLEADPVPLELAEWGLQVSCWRPKPVKWKISGHRGGQGDKRVGSEVASLWQPAGSPPCSPSLCHAMDEGWLAAMGWLSSCGLPASCWCYLCRGSSAEDIHCRISCSLPTHLCNSALMSSLDVLT